MDRENFILLLKQLTVNDSFVRKNAESHYDNYKKDANSCIFSLLTVITNQSVEEYIRMLALVLLRRSLIEEEDSTYFKLQSENQKLFLSRLIEHLNKESNSIVLVKLSDLVGEFAGFILEPGSWPEIVHFAFSSAQATNTTNRETGLRLLSSVSCSFNDNSLDSTLLPQLLTVLQNTFHDNSNSNRLVILSLKLLISIFQGIESESRLEGFLVLVDSVFIGFNQILQGFLEDRQNDDSLCVYVEGLIEIAEIKPNFFICQLNMFYPGIIQILNQNLLPESSRNLLMEFIVTLFSISPKSMRKFKGPSNESNYGIAVFLPVCLKLMCNIEMDENWEKEENIEDLDKNEEDCEVGESCFNRCCVSLGVKSTYSIVSQLLAPYLSSQDWKLQHTGLISIANYLEVSINIKDPVQLSQHQKEVFSTIIIFNKSNNPRVRNATFFMLNQFLVLHGSYFNEEQLSQILEILFSHVSIGLNPIVRIRRMILICLVSLIDIAPSTFVENRAADLLNNIVLALQEGPTIIQECCVNALLSIAETMKGPIFWSPFYSSLMPILKKLLQFAQEQGQESLWGQTLECCALIGEAAGKQLFYDDAIEMLQMLMMAQKSVQPDSQPEMYLMKAWVRIARCVGSEFLPYIPMIMENLLAALSQDVTVDKTTHDLAELEERSDIEMLEADDGEFLVVRTAAVEQQLAACQLIALLAEKLQGDFYPYIEQTTRLLSKLVESPHEDIRSQAIAAIPELLKSTGLAVSVRENRSPLVELAGFCMGLLIRSVETEAAMDMIMTGLLALQQVLLYGCTNWNYEIGSRVFVTGEGGSEINKVEKTGVFIPILSVGQMTALTNCAKVVFRDSLQRRAVLRAEAQVSGGADENDETDEQMFMQQSLELHFHISDLLKTIFKTHGSAFFPVYFDQWQDLIVNLAHIYCLKEDRKFAFSIIQDAFEYGLTQDTAKFFIPTIFSFVLDNCLLTVKKDQLVGTELEIRINCVQIINIFVLKFPEVFTHFAEKSIQALGKCISAGDELGEPRGSCTDLAVSTVGNIVDQMGLINSVNLNFLFLIDQMLAYLPLKHDKEESNKTIKLLLKWMNSSYPLIFNSIQRILRSIAIITEVINTGMVENKVNEDCINWIKLIPKLSQQLNQDLVSLSKISFSAENLQKFENIIFN